MRCDRCYGEGRPNAAFGYCAPCEEQTRAYAVEREGMLIAARKCIQDLDLTRGAITTWRFDDAPDALRAVSSHGGDEDWLSVVPPEVWESTGGWISWLEDGPYGVCRISDDVTSDGWRIVIGAHA